MSNEELLQALVSEIDLIMHDKGYRFLNEDGTWYSKESCKDLTNEEVFEELKYELRQQDKLIEQFQDKELKETNEDESLKIEKRFKKLEKQVKKQSKDIENLKQTINDEYQAKIDCIQQQMRPSVLNYLIWK